MSNVEKNANGIPVLNVGDGVTMNIGSDRYPATVIAVSKSGRKVTVQHDTATATEDSNYYGDQSYTYEANPNGRIAEFSYRTSAKGFVQKGEAISYYATCLSQGRRRYSDPSF